MPKIVSSKVIEYLNQEQQIGGYEIASKRKNELDAFYTSAAKLIHCEPDEIARCESSTRGWQQFFYSVDFKPDDKIITTRADYGSNVVAYIHAAKKSNVQFEFIDIDNNGDLNLEHLSSLIDKRTKLISVSHVPTGGGIVNDAESIGDIAQDAGVPYLLDACQSVGHLDLDVKKLKCTALTTTGRKYLRGPRGSGFLYVARKYFQSNEPAYLEQQGVNLIDENNYELIDSAKRYENFECNFGGRIGLATAIDYANNIGTRDIEDRIFALAQRCRNNLHSIPKVSVHDQGTRQCGIVTFSVEGQIPVEIRSQLSKNGINIWVSSGPGSLIDFQRRGLDAVCRASIHYFNSEAEVDHFSNVVENLK